MNEFVFDCIVCGEVSDDGDIHNKVCMGCDDKMNNDRNLEDKAAD